MGKGGPRVVRSNFFPFMILDTFQLFVLFTLLCPVIIKKMATKSYHPSFLKKKVTIHHYRFSMTTTRFLDEKENQESNSVTTEDMSIVRPS